MTQLKVQQKKLTPTELGPPTFKKIHLKNEDIPQKDTIIDSSSKNSQRSNLECKQLIMNETHLNSCKEEFEECRRGVEKQQITSIERFMNAKKLCMDYLARLRKSTNIKEVRVLVTEMNDMQDELLNFGGIDLVHMNLIKDKDLLIEELEDHIEDFEEWEKDYGVFINDKIDEILKIESNLERLKRDYSDLMVSTNNEIENLRKCMQDKLDTAMQAEGAIKEVNKQQMNIRKTIENAKGRIQVIESCGRSNQILSIPQRAYKDIHTESELDPEKSKFNSNSNVLRNIQLKSSANANNNSFTQAKCSQSFTKFPLEKHLGERASHTPLKSSATILPQQSSSKEIPHLINNKRVHPELIEQKGKFETSMKSEAWKILYQCISSIISTGEIKYNKVKDCIRKNSIIILEDRLWKIATLEQKEFIIKHSKHFIWDDRFPQTIEDLSDEEASLLTAPQILVEQGLHVIEDIILLHPYELLGIKKYLNKQWPGLNFIIYTSITYPKRISSIEVSITKSRDQVKNASIFHCKIKKIASRSVVALNKKQYSFGEYEFFGRFIGDGYTVMYESEFRDLIE